MLNLKLKKTYENIKNKIWFKILCSREYLKIRVNKQYKLTNKNKLNEKLRIKKY